jgi:nitroreductase
LNFLNLVKERYSVRRYSNKPVQREKIERCIEAARLAPSTCNSQPWRFIVVEDTKLKEAIARETYSKVLSFNSFSKGAPVLIIVISERKNISAKIAGIIKKRDFSLIDIGIAAEHICLQAVEEGLGTCMLGWFDEEAVKKLLNIPKQKRIELIITLGYPDESVKKKSKKRKDIDCIRSYNCY